jgi:hypothetical protein
MDDKMNERLPDEGQPIKGMEGGRSLCVGLTGHQHARTERAVGSLPTPVVIPEFMRTGQPRDWYTARSNESSASSTVWSANGRVWVMNTPAIFFSGSSQ